MIFNGPFDRHPALDLLNTGVVYQGFDGGVACGVFVTTPLFLLLFTRNSRFNPLRAALWVTLGLFLAALLPFYSTGAYQFGARLLYDAYAYAFLLLALSDVRADWRFAVLGLLGFAINVLGALQVWTDVMLHI